MTRQLHRAALPRFALRVGLGVTMTAGVVALSVPGGAASVALALALGAGSLVALSGLGERRRSRARVTAPRRS